MGRNLQSRLQRKEIRKNQVERFDKIIFNCNRRALNNSSMVVLLLPCGLDSHADWAYAVGKGKYTAVVGSPKAGERTPSHMWCDEMLDSDDDIEGWCLDVKRFGDKERLNK
jgi:hypothetical protein